jgi:hypothetical protein
MFRSFCLSMVIVALTVKNAILASIGIQCFRGVIIIHFKGLMLCIYHTTVANLLFMQSED